MMRALNLVTPALSRGLPSLHTTQKAGGSRVKPGMTISVLFALIAACSDASVPANEANVVADNVVIAETEGGEEIEAGNGAMPPFAEVSGAHPIAPEPAPIPAKFRGTWAETRADCDPENPTWLAISGRTVRSPNYVLFGERFTFPKANSFALDGKYEGSGQAGAAHYSINAGGDVLTDEAGGGMVRVRCG